MTDDDECPIKLERRDGRRTHRVAIPVGTPTRRISGEARGTSGGDGPWYEYSGEFSDSDAMSAPSSLPERGSLSQQVGYREDRASEDYFESASDATLTPPDSTSSQTNYREGSPSRIVHAPARRKQRLLRAALSSVPHLDSTTAQNLLAAEGAIGRASHAEAVRYLEAGLEGARRHPRLESLVWLLLAGQHTASGDFQKASVCLLHRLAFCREHGDFPGVTKAQCSLGITYLKLGLLKLAGRCFLQYLCNCQLLNDTRGTALAYSNLGVLSKLLASRGCQAAAAREGDGPGAREAVRVHLRRAVVYFEHHLELVEQQADV